MKKIIIPLILLLMIFIVSADIFEGVGKKTSATITPEFNLKQVTLVEDDPNINCYASGNQIICNPLNATQEENIKSELGIIGSLEYKFLGLPIKEIDGAEASLGHFSSSETTIITVDTSKGGLIHAGFNSDVFQVVELSTGVFNKTQQLSGDIYLTTGAKLGQYWSDGLNLNNTKTIINITFEKVTPANTNISVALRTHNMTDGETTGLAENLLAYYKFDEYNLLDYSTKNRSITTRVGNGQVTANGTFNGDYWFDEASYIRIDNETIPSITFGGYAVSIWVKINGQTGTATDYIYERSFGNDLLMTTSQALRCGVNTATSGGEQRTGGVTVTIGQWNHIVCNYNATTGVMTLYKNGVASATKTITPNETLSTGTTPVFAIGARNGGSLAMNGEVDEMMIYNKPLSQSEITTLASGEYKTWSSYSSEYTTSPSTVTVEDGKVVQVRATLARLTGSENVHFDNFTIAYDVVGTTVSVDNPPTASLVTADGIVFTSHNVSLNFSATDDMQLVNATLWTNTTGTWHRNETITISGTSVTNSFFNLNVSDGGYIWNVQVYDNATIPQNTWGVANRTFTVSTACVESVCNALGYTCNPSTNSCYTTCSSHSHVNATNYCGTDNLAHLQVSDGGMCLNLELTGLADNNICLGGYCYTDNIPATNEYCTDQSTGCVDNGIEYSAGTINCAVANDYYQCSPGGDVVNPWTFTDCVDAGDPTNPSGESPTISEHNYCGFYSASTCSISGCSVPVTNNCGAYFFNTSVGVCGDQVSGVTDDIKRHALDVGCFAVYDLSTCPPPNTLSVDGITCTPPETNDPPTVTLVSPPDSSIQTTTTITFQYGVADGDNQKNCSLFFTDNLNIWHLNQTNSSAISLSSTNSFTPLTFPDLDTVTWNVECMDSINQTGYASLNSTFTIDTTFVGEKRIIFYFGNETNTPVLTINETGTTNVSHNLLVGNDIFIGGELRDLNGGIIDISQLKISSLLDIEGIGLTGVRITNPSNEYIGFTGKSSGGNIIFGLFESNPLITTSSGSLIKTDVVWNFTKNLYINNITGTGNANFDGNISSDYGFFNSIGSLSDRTVGYFDNINSNYILVNNDLNITNALNVIDAGYIKALQINPTSDTEFGGGFGDTGATIQADGDVFINGNLVVDGTQTFAGTQIISGDIEPADDNIFDIGNETDRWRYGYFGTDVIINRSLDVNEGTLFIDGASSGNVGVGTFTPQQKLNVKGTANVTGTLFIDTDVNILGTTLKQFAYNQTATKLFYNQSLAIFGANIAFRNVSLSGNLTVGTATTNADLSIYSVDDAVSDEIKIYNGATLVGTIGTEDATWLRLNQETAMNIYTPNYFRADSGLFVDGATYGINATGGLYSLGGIVIGVLNVTDNTNIGGTLRITGTTIATGAITFDGDLASSGTNIGWINKTGVNTACDTTCAGAGNTGCVTGFVDGAVNDGAPTKCDDGKADMCLCT
jgi:hypothetical protein